MAAAPSALQLHLTPTYSSWLNLVERWFAELTNRKLCRLAHRSVAELEAGLRAWIDAWNEDPKPFVWTKTADEILDNLAGYLNASITQDTDMERLVKVMVLPGGWHGLRAAGRSRRRA